MKKNVQHGNKAKIDPNKSVIPQYLTNTITPKKVQTGNVVPETVEENAYFAKEYVDENHK
ncbi:MAG: hypothetical protein RR444_02510 [Oscillospiraceae bacterium]